MNIWLYDHFRDENDERIIYTIYIQTFIVCYNISGIAPSGLHLVYIDPGNLQVIPNWTLYLI